MEKINAEEIVKATGGKLINGNSDKKILGVSIDTRTLKKGEMFFALKGERFDGHNFCSQAIKKGASCIVVNRLGNLPVKRKNRQTAFIKTKDTLTALQKFSSYYRSKFKLKVIGITGSNGKTTTKDMLSKILSRKYRVISTPGNFNNIIGLPLSLFKIGGNTEFGVFEMGANHPGEIKLLSKISSPEYGLITNIGKTHLGFFGSPEKVFRAKMELAKNLPERGVLFLNFDDKFLAPARLGRMKGVRCKIITYGISKGADIRARKIEVTNKKSSFEFMNQRINLTTVTKYNIYNALGACAISHKIGISLKAMKKALEEFNLPKFHYQLLKKGKMLILNDSYNANPTSVEVVIKETMENFPKRKKVLVLGDMLELGTHSSKLHREVGEIVGKNEVSLLFAFGNKSKWIARGALESGMRTDKVFFYKSKEKLIKKLKRSLCPQDLVLIKGSRKMGMEEIARALILK